MEDEAAEQRAEHTARESHQAAQTQQVAQQGGHEGYAHAIVRPQQDGTEDVDHVLDGGAFAAENGEGEDAAHDGEGAEHTGQRQLFCRVVFHDECSFSIKISCGSRQTAAPAHEQNRHPRRCQKRKKRSRLIGLLSRRNTASHRNI